MGLFGQVSQQERNDGPPALGVALSELFQVEPVVLHSPCPQEDASEGGEKERPGVPRSKKESRPLRHLAKVVGGGHVLEKAAARDLEIWHKLKKT